MKVSRGILFLCFGALCALVLAENENVTDVDPGAGNEVRVHNGKFIVKIVKLICHLSELSGG